MSIGYSIKQGFLALLRAAGGTVIIHKHWDTPRQNSAEVKGLKNNEKGKPHMVMFQFSDHLDIEPNDVLQQKGSNDLWRVVETEDHIHGDLLAYFEAKVEKITAARTIHPPTPSTAQVIIHGPNYGGIQVASSNSSQSVSIGSIEIHQQLGQLRDLAEKMALDETDKEELLLAIERVGQLAEKPKSEAVLSRVKEKIDLIKSMFDLSLTIGPIALPYIQGIAQFFGFSL
ncbi:MAG: hypothetical protein HXX12_16725 [Geothrix sp.]|uniref:hypothetical protein n=1 Tax=Geothrix sp. TaxID=1962974 RepID=UPI0017AC41F0|nr:hypothetical protein [Geothrix sp.]NWJ42608.1 hypothetical protein [Geothrix sp.]WIL19440.1 MAG: hypothetical protein QOZ81_001957 [Geothrix sp.]